MNFLDANKKVIVNGVDEQPGKINYFVGKERSAWVTNLSHFSRVHYDELYPGVDFLFHGDHGRLKYDIELDAGIDPGVVRLEVAGADGLSIDDAGQLVIETAAGSVVQSRPVIHQSSNGTLVTVSGGWRLLDSRIVGFEVGAYDKSKPLVIDPVVSYATYVGYATPFGIDANKSDDVFVTGSAIAGFPATPGAFQPEAVGLRDAVVLCMNPIGSGLVYASYIGGNAHDEARDIVVDRDGSAYIGGDTDSFNMPLTSSDIIQFYKLAPDRSGFVAKLSADGSDLKFFTYMGARGEVNVRGIDVDDSGKVYVTGHTASALDFLVLDNVEHEVLGPRDVFVVKLNNDATQVDYLTFLRGSDMDRAVDIAVDASERAYIVGATRSTDLPVSDNAADDSFNGESDVFVGRLSGDGAIMEYLSYLGGSAADFPAGVAIGPQGYVYLAGTTLSTDFPVTAGAFQPQFGGGLQDAFVTILKAEGGGDIMHSTYLGGEDIDFATGIDVGITKEAWVSGGTLSTLFPTADPIQESLGGPQDGFIARLAADAGALKFSSYMGGANFDTLRGVALNAFGDPFLTGTADPGFPTTSAVFRPTWSFQGEIGPGLVLVRVGLNDTLPDLAISNDGGASFAGNNAFGVILGQIREQHVNADNPAVYVLRLKNRAALEDGFMIRAAGSRTGWTTRFYSAATGGVEVTDAVMGSGWYLGRFAAGSSDDFCLEVTPAVSAESFPPFSVDVIAISASNAQNRDVNRAKTRKLE